MTRFVHARVVSDRHLSDGGCFASDGERDCIARFDVSGVDGRDGRDGQSYFQPPRMPGRNGQLGGDATNSQPGQDAGIVELDLTYLQGSRQTGVLVLDGSVDQPGTAHDPIHSAIQIGSCGYVFVRAVGGKGGNGGRGGDGQPGVRGVAGRNATRFNSGGNGGPGGNGGNAGNPTDGSPGGAGGFATLRLHQRDLGLLMLIKGYLAGGEIGFAGEGGVGGLGGAGGPGGSSYHWTERRSYRDANGKLRSRTVFRSNPGGWKGRRGRDGARSSYRAKDGIPGEVGELKIGVVDDVGRTTTYRSPYDLELVTFDIASECDILEPDSIVSVDNLVLRNCGGMPTPDNYTIRVHLPADRWLLTDEVDLVMHRSLGPDETYTFSAAGLRFRFGDYVVDQPHKKPFSLRHTVSPQARMESGIGRPFRQFENGEELTVQFPVQLAGLTCLKSIAPGESTRLIWAVKNIGEESFDQKYLYRAVQSQLRLLGGDLNADRIKFFDTDDRPFAVTESVYRKPISDLGPGETRVIETRIGVEDTDGIVAYQGFQVGVDLDLQRPRTSDRSNEFRCVDFRKTFIRIAERYLKQESSRFLLIANQKTTVADIDHWTQLADYFGSTLDVWDVSYNGFFDLARAVERDKSLLEQWRGMTMIIPNNYYQTPDGKTVAFKELSKSQFLKAASDCDINFYIVGDSRTGGEAMLADTLIPVDGSVQPSGLKTQHEFLKQVTRASKYIERTREVRGGAMKDAHAFADEATGAFHELEIDKRTVLFQPKQAWLEAEARRLQTKLKKTDPLHRWVIVHRYDTGDTDTSWGLFKKRKVGTLEVRRTLDSSKGSVVLYEVEPIEMTDDNFITSEANKHGIFLALKFEDKVDRFIRLVSERKFPRYTEDYVDRPLSDAEVQEIGDELVDSILVDLYNEQNVARNCRTWGRWGVAPLLPKLNYLAERSLNYGLTLRQMEENEVCVKLLYDVIANIQYMARNAKTVWDSALIPTSFFKRGRAVSAHMLERAEQIITSIFGREPSWWEKASSTNDDYNPFGGARKKAPKGIERREADRRIREVEQRLKQENRSIKDYTTAQDRPGLTYDPELLTHESRVMSGEQYDVLVNQEQQATVRRQQTEQAVRAERSDLLVPLEKPKTVQSQVATPQH